MRIRSSGCVQGHMLTQKVYIVLSAPFLFIYSIDYTNKDQTRYQAEGMYWAECIY